MAIFQWSGTAAVLIAVAMNQASAQAVETPPATLLASPGAENLRIEWEVKNRFRLFRSERDFQRHVAAYRTDGVLGAEQRLAQDTGGRGWARSMLGSLCLDAAGRLTETCVRDGISEQYLAPDDHRIGVLLANAPTDATCAWSFEDGLGAAQQVTVPCEEEVTLRVRYGRPTIANVDVARADGASERGTIEILVRDLLIAGLGDSIASGDGNPDRAILLSDDGFCFRRFLGGDEYFRPGRSGYSGAKACGSGGAEPVRLNTEWTRHGARWISPGCHRSLYGYQMRTALALAVENPHDAVTFLPLACTGATIEDGLIDRQRARETSCEGAARGTCPAFIPGQLAQLRDALALAHRRRADRALDLVLLTIGANDIGFSELVADVIVQSATERTLFKRSGMIGAVQEADQVLRSKLPINFSRLRAGLKNFVGGNLARVVFVSYANPALQAGGTPCGAGLDGFDVHPAFRVDGERLRQVTDFIGERFLPTVRALASCEPGACQNPSAERMTFVDAHQRLFADHGFCARAETDPVFDRECFSATGDSFRKDPVEGAAQPLACGRSVGEFRPYAPRARWIRTANDSYFTAMTYPEGLPASLQPNDIHDASWGVMSTVYGGAIHPTAEGHAAMADAVLPAVREILGLSAPTQ